MQADQPITAHPSPRASATDRRPSPLRSLRRLLPVFLLLASLLGPAAAWAAEVVRLSFSETVRQADAIVTGKVLSKNSRWGDASQRWMLTDYEFAVDEVLYAAPGQAAPGQTITLTYWGGTIGNETQGASDVRLPVPGEQLAVMLRSGWQHEVSATPLVGLNQGLFTISAATADDRTLTVRDFGGTSLAVLPDGHVLQRRDSHALAANAPGATLAAFTSWLKANVAAIKAAPIKPKPAVDWNDPRIIKPFAKTPAPLTGVVHPQGSLVPPTVASHLPLTDAEATAPAAPAGRTRRPASASASASTWSVPLKLPEIRPITNYPALEGTANLPIVVNPLPTSFYWSPEDQYQMSKWNYYAQNIFLVSNPTGTYSWPDGVFDLDGFPQSADLQRIYGYSWDANTIGITFFRTSGSTIVEADIALNPAFGFTLDDEWVYNGGNVQGFRQVLTHELGHMHGLNHQFNFLSVMNYMPAQFRAFGLPYMDDAQAARANYPSIAVSHTDLGIYLYYESGYQSVTDATYPGSLNAGDVLTVNDYHLENVGTTTVDTPTVEWYLSDARNYDGTYYYLGASSYSPGLNPFQYYTTSAVSESFVVPTYVTPGTYYLGAYIRGDDGASQASFPFSNNFAFSRLTIQVNPALPTVDSFSPTSGQVGTSVTIYGSSFDTVYGVYFNGTSAPFSIVSSTQITATVPSGATTGAITVYNASGGGTSNGDFTVSLPTPVITSAAAVTTTQGLPFSYQITATNSPTSYGVQGLLTGLTINASTGLISGTPKGAGKVTMTLNATNSYGKGSATLTLTVTAAAPVVTGGAISAAVNTAFSYQIQATNNPASYGVQGLPGGLSISASTGVISGTPKATGKYTLTLNAYNAVGKGSATLTLTVMVPVPVVTGGFASGTVGKAFSYQIQATNNPTSYGVQGLPGGLSINATTGLLSGTPKTAGKYTLTLNATNGGGRGSNTLTLTVASNVPPAITSAATANGKVGVAFSYQITATNSPTSYGVQGLPTGLSVGGSTGLISGTPKMAGTYMLTLNAYNPAGKGSATLKLTVAAP